MSMDDGPVMVITGTSKGIGRAMAEHYLRAGYRVEGCSRGPSTLDTDGYQHSRVDVAEEEEVRNWVREVKGRRQGIDVLVCCAGVAPAALLVTTTSAAVLDSVLATNVKGTYLVCREVAKMMMQRRQGRIVTISTMAVGLHQEGTSAYAASKSAIVEMTKILAKELAPVTARINFFSEVTLKIHASMLKEQCVFLPDTAIPVFDAFQSLNSV